MKDYETTDILLAACLLFYDYGLRAIEKEGSKGTFIFVEVDEKFINDYDMGNMRVEPVAFNSEVKRLTTSVRRMANWEIKIE